MIYDDVDELQFISRGSQVHTRISPVHTLSEILSEPAKKQHSLQRNRIESATGHRDDIKLTDGVIYVIQSMRWCK